MANSRLEEIRKVRIQKLNKLKELGINPYPTNFSKSSISIKEALEKMGDQVSAFGRLRSWREHGNVVFADLKDSSGKIQLLFQKKNLEENFKTLKYFDTGDFLGVSGAVTKTTAGETTIDVSYFELLGKSLRPLPDDYSGLKDIEERYRKRYLDLLLDDSIRQRFDVRTKVLTETRNYLDALGFQEVETPMFHPQYGGANARPFMSHMHALDVSFYLRIAFELYLKRLVVGGYEKVYEIGRDFRNEGIDQTHNPEFTMLEWYEANADYHRVMDVTEGLFKHLAKKIHGTTTIKAGDNTVDIGKTWPRITMESLLKDRLNLDVQNLDLAKLIKYCHENSIPLLGGETKGQVIFTIFDEKIAKTLLEPTFVIDYPEDISPLSKPHRSKPGWVERFEGYIGGKEIVDGWSELTDPLVQRQRWEFDMQASRKDKIEAQQLDEEFLEAMEYGMPPLGGIGIGIDRLTMFFSNTWSLKEVILFPTLRPSAKVKKIAQDFEQKFVIVIDKNLPDWKIMNTSGHIAAFLGNKMSAQFDTGDSFVTKDGVKLPKNTQFPIITLQASAQELVELISQVRKTDLVHIGYISEMMETTNDNKIASQLVSKNEKDVVYAGVGIFGPKKDLDLLTKSFTLWGK